MTTTRLDRQRSPSYFAGSLQVDYCIGGNPRYYPGEPGLMLVPDEIRKCVAFLLYQTADGPKLAGTTFFVGVEHPEISGASVFGCAVTAKHVIEGIRRRSIDGKAYLRLNIRDASAQLVGTNLSDWRFHPSEASVDVAVLQIGLPEQIDHLFYPVASFVTDQLITELKIGIGEEVFLAGLFYGHFGTRRNTPIIRTGNIAAMPEEPVYTEDLGLIDAYLVEARSIGGLSGSPVFVHLGGVRPTDEGQLRFVRSIYGIHYLLGLMHGHWDRPTTEHDTMVVDEDRSETVNMGIGVVVPAKKILEVIHQPEFETLMQKRIDDLRKARSPTADIK
jgi:hypothetical protein